MNYPDILDYLVTYWSQCIGVFMLLLLYKFGVKGAKKKLQHRHLTEIHNDEKNEYISCNSPGCVRCRAYTQRSMDVLYKEWLEYERNLDPVSKSGVNRISRTLKQHGHKSAENSPKFRLSSLESQPIFDREEFSKDVRSLENHSSEIYADYKTISQLISSASGWKINSTPSGKWNVFHLVNQGREIQENIARCPATYRIVKELHNFMSNVMFGNACFSVVYPGTKITEHTGPCNLRARCHLGLQTPEHCSLHVDGEILQWSVGKCFIFDDFYPHSVSYHQSNKADTPRVVFMVDFWHPKLSNIEREALSYLLDSAKIKL